MKGLNMYRITVNFKPGTCIARSYSLRSPQGDHLLLSCSLRRIYLRALMHWGNVSCPKFKFV